MLNIVIPCAGAGSRFIAAGYTAPKPFIKFLDKFMIEHVIDNIAIPEAKYIFIMQQDHLKTYGPEFIDVLKSKSYIKDFETIQIDGLTEGAACTLLKVKALINNTNELLIANSDQMLGSNDIYNSIKFFRKYTLDGGILCFYNRAPKWSYIAMNDRGFITEVAEKQVISNYATCGIYYFNNGKDFVWAAETMIEKNNRFNNEFYIAPVFNYLIPNPQSVYKPFLINEMYGIGTPEDLESYLKYNV